MIKTKVSFWKIFHTYWILGKQYPISGLTGSFAYLFANGIIGILSPLVYKHIVDAVSQGVPGDIAAYHGALLWVGLLAGLLLLSNALFRIGDFVLSYFESNVMRLCANLVFEKVHNHSYAFFADNFSGSLVSKAKRFIGAFTTIYDNILWNFAANALRVVGAAIVLFYTEALLGMAYLVWIGIFLVIAVYFMRKKIPYDIAEAEADSTAIARYADTITNALTLKMFATTKREFSRFHRVTAQWEKARRKAWYMLSYQNLAQGLLFFFLEGVLMFLAVWLWYQGETTVGTIVLVQIYIFGTFDALWGFSRALSGVEKALADAKEMVEIFEQKPSVTDPARPEKCRIQKGEIDFQDVSFAYEKNNRKVFDGFSLHIAPGEKVGLVGHSGAGKTTITKMLLRFADISGGAIYIDGQNIATIRQDDLRQSLSYVPQDPLLFHRSLRENIAYGRPNATEAEIIEAARRAHAHEFIEQLPAGYDTLVGERGVKLSGGERQRVAIARAMLKDAPILILDEATSSLDSMSERYIQDALTELMKGRTTIVIAHRLSTIQKMDRILVVENGSVVEEGSHTDLMRHNGLYATFWRQQAGGFIAE